MWNNIAIIDNGMLCMGMNWPFMSRNILSNIEQSKSFWISSHCSLKKRRDVLISETLLEQYFKDFLWEFFQNTIMSAVMKNTSSGIELGNTASNKRGYYSQLDYTLKKSFQGNFLPQQKVPGKQSGQLFDSLHLHKCTCTLIKALVKHLTKQPFWSVWTIPYTNEKGC